MDNPSPNASPSSLSASNPPKLWYETIAHDGTSPFIPNGSQWKVFRNVVSDYGADPTGNSDSKEALQEAINGKWRSRKDCNVH